jgi:hypothetical protein
MRLLVPAVLTLASVLPAADLGPTSVVRQPDVVAAVAAMTCDAQAVGLFRAKGLEVMNITWEDTGRWQNSSVGPNISDLTIQVLGQPSRQGFSGCMPVVRFPNFADLSCDVPIDSLKLLVGNQRGLALEAVSLRTYLERFREFQHSPTGYLDGSLLAERDRQVLTSAQACFLPVPQGGQATFAPVLFNYQSRPGNPAVLVILATPEGTSAQVVENDAAVSAGVAHGQRLFHNADGRRTALTASRFSDFQRQQAAQGQATPGDQATRDGLSLCMVIQVPLLVPEFRREVKDLPAPTALPMAGCASACVDERSLVETAVVQAGPPEGPWIGLNGRTLRRDTRFPIRATVQFYQATTSSRVGSQDVERIAQAIQRVYLDADAVGSLVVGGCTGRTTAHVETPDWPQPWWQKPCLDWQAASGQHWQRGVEMVRSRLGADWQPRDARELGNALALVR